METEKLHYYVMTKEYTILMDTHTRNYDQALAYANLVLPNITKENNIRDYVIGTCREITV